MDQSTASIGQLILNLIFYVLMGGFLTYSGLTIYTLLRFGRDRALALIISIIYLILAAGLYAAAVSNLNQIKL